MAIREQNERPSADARALVRPGVATLKGKIVRI
jgi:hypothetical protein